MPVTSLSLTDDHPDTAESTKRAIPIVTIMSSIATLENKGGLLPPASDVVTAPIVTQTTIQTAPASDAVHVPESAIEQSTVELDGVEHDLNTPSILLKNRVEDEVPFSTDLFVADSAKGPITDETISDEMETQLTDKATLMPSVVQIGTSGNDDTAQPTKESSDGVEMAMDINSEKMCSSRILEPQTMTTSKGNEEGPINSVTMEAAVPAATPVTSTSPTFYPIFRTSIEWQDTKSWKNTKSQQELDADSMDKDEQQNIISLLSDDASDVKALTKSVTIATESGKSVEMKSEEEFWRQRLRTAKLKNAEANAVIKTKEREAKVTSMALMIPLPAAERAVVWEAINGPGELGQRNQVLRNATFTEPNSLLRLFQIQKLTQNHTTMNR
jgi:hypothetical protein